MTPEYVIGIDLHGTLLDERWEIKDVVINELLDSLRAVRRYSVIYVCSGNDLTFIERYVPEVVRRCFDGYLLETGCVVSDGKEEEIIIPNDRGKVIGNLENLLKRKEFPEIKYFARRLITISMFTADPDGGTDPADFFPIVSDFVREAGYGGEVLVTHSNVAVDIIPRGFNKFTGLKHVAGNAKTVGIADSMNDLHLITDADYSFIPSNASPKLVSRVRDMGIDVLPLEGSEELKRGVVLQSAYHSTRAVVDILNFIRQKRGELSG